MKKIYKIRDKYFYDGKVQLAMPRMKENLLISKNGIEYVEVSDNYNLIKSSSYHAPKGSSAKLPPPRTWARCRISCCERP